MLLAVQIRVSSIAVVLQSVIEFLFGPFVIRVGFDRVDVAQSKFTKEKRLDIKHRQVIFGQRAVHVS